jgi:regulator of ribonuclease activity A
MSSVRPITDLCDEHGDQLQVLAPGFIEFGGASSFSGVVTTLRVHEDNALVRDVLTGAGRGRVLVVDGDGSLRCALVGGNLAKLAEQNQWSGIVVWGAIRDVLEIRQCRIGVRALAANPRKSQKSGAGQRDVPLQIAGVTVHPGDWHAADADGMILAPRPL